MMADIPDQRKIFVPWRVDGIGLGFNTICKIKYVDIRIQNIRVLYYQMKETLSLVVHP